MKWRRRAETDLSMTAIELLDELSSSSEGEIELREHPYQRASEEEQLAYDRKIEHLEQRREARERAAASAS